MRTRINLKKVLGMPLKKYTHGFIGRHGRVGIEPVLLVTATETQAKGLQCDISQVMRLEPGFKLLAWDQCMFRLHGDLFICKLPDQAYCWNSGKEKSSETGAKGRGS